MKIDLHKMAVEFSRKWGPQDNPTYLRFTLELRTLLEAYGKAALFHESLPDTEHKHGDPVAGMNYCFDCGARLMGGATEHKPACAIRQLIDRTLEENL